MKEERKIGKHIVVRDGSVYANGEPMFSERLNCRIYENTIIEAKDYAFAVLRAESGLEVALPDAVVLSEEESGRVESVPLYSALGWRAESGFETAFRDANGDFIYTAEEGKTVRVFPERVFAPIPTPGETKAFSGVPAPGNLKELFHYTVCEDLGVLMELKEKDRRRQLLFYPGFTTEFDTFKIWNIGTEHVELLCLNSETGEHTVAHRPSKDWTQGYRYYEVYKALMPCIKSVFPNHPAYRTEFYVQAL